MNDSKLVTQDDILTETGINIKEKLNVKTNNVAERWIRRQEQIIFNHIAKYKYNGMNAVVRMLNNESARKVIFDAVIEQISYLVVNNLIDPSQIIGITGKSGDIRAENSDAIRMYSVAPLAHDILLNGGLLYCGEGLYDIF